MTAKKPFLQHDLINHIFLPKAFNIPIFTETEKPLYVGLLKCIMEHIVYQRLLTDQIMYIPTASCPTGRANTICMILGDPETKQGVIP